ncbi:MAG TPA: ABC transporter permease [Xanthobacteraceae bacterium]|nr:ABC transporter permease [Xanthobacteraceae bacterium]
MLAFLTTRLAQAIPVLFGVSLAVFLMLHLIPGDPAALIAGADATAADVENVRQSLGLDRPLAAQYLGFVGRALSGDFGKSFRTGRPVLEEVLPRYANTLALGAIALSLAIVIGMASGIVSAVRRHTLFDNAALILSLAGVSMPTFFLGLMLMLVFSVWLGWLPLSGMSSWAHFILPAITLSTASVAIISRVMHASLIEVLSEDYVRTARAKGQRESVVIWRHAVRNALIPVVTVAGLQLGYLLGGAVVTETVFAWPGLGRLLVQSILARDFPVVQASVLLLAVSFVAINLATDLIYGLIDPRIRAR